MLLITLMGIIYFVDLNKEIEYWPASSACYWTSYSQNDGSEFAKRITISF